MEKELALSVVESHADFVSLREEWNRLVEASAMGGVCLRWEWLNTWWDIYHDEDARLYAILVRDDSGRLVGLAPFYVQIRKRFGLRMRILRFLGTGEPEWEEVASEYLDIAALPGYEERVAQRIWNFMRAKRCWDQLLFNDVLENSVVLTALRRALDSEKMSVDLETVGVRYSIRLPRSREEYMAQLGPGAARRLPYKRRKLERAGVVAEKAIVDPKELDQAFEELIRLHRLRWRAEGKEGVFTSPRFADFHRRLARSLLSQGLLKLRFLSLDGKNLAVLYNLRHGSTEYFYQGGSDRELAAKHSPGLIAHLYAIEGAIQDGLESYDFMKGGTRSYKSEFACEESPMHEMHVFAKTLRGRILAVESWLRRRRRALRPEAPVVEALNAGKNATTPIAEARSF